MVDTASLIRMIQHKFPTVESVTGKPNILCWKRMYQSMVFSHHYIDMSQCLTENDFNLVAYQDSLLSQDFYANRGPLQWNFYLVFVVDSEAFNSLREAGKLGIITGDTQFARKYVIQDRDLDQFLTNIASIEPPSTQFVDDLISAWIKRLDNASLSGLYSKHSRTQVISDLASGIVHSPSSSDFQTTNAMESIPFIRSVEYSNYRHLPDKSYTFAPINLVFGPNGSGKTSLLEAIELAICGQTRSNGTEPKGTIRIQYMNGTLDSYEGENNSKYRRRDEILYGKSYRNGNRMAESFSKYNFLATDSAFHLAHSETPEALKAAFKNFVVGNDITAFENHLRGYEKDLGIQISRLRSEVESKTQTLNGINERIQKIHAASDNQAAESFRSVTAAIVKIPFADHKQITPETLMYARDACLLAKAILQNVYDNLGWTAPLSFNRIKSFQNTLELSLKQELDLRETIANLSNRMSTLEYDLGQSAGKANIVRRLTSILSIPGIQEFAYHHQNRDINAAGAERVKIGTALASDLESFAQNATFAEISLKHLSSEINETRTALSRLELEIHDIRRILSEIDGLQSELRVIGTKVLELEKQYDVCPLCKHKHPTGYLSEALSKPGGTNLETTLLTNALEKQSVLVKHLTELELAEALSRKTISWLTTLPSDDQFNIERSIRAINDDLIKVEQSADNHKQYVEICNQLSTSGVSIDAALESLGFIQSKYPNANQQSMQAALEKEMRDLAAESTRISEDMSGCQRELGEVQAQLTKTLETLPDHPPAFAENAIPRQSQMDILMSVALKFDELKMVIEVKPGDDLLLVLREVDSALYAIATFEAFNTQTKSSLENLKTDQALATKTRDDLKDSHLQLERLSAAQKSLTEILEQEGVSRYMADFMDSYQKSIVGIFKRIHSPAEFVNLHLGAEDLEQIILDRYDGSRHNLSQISTGQRSALALSIFLALNSSIRTRVNLMLIDDPVAHVDDLNSLSFLDYLRNVAVSNTQIIFATADEKLAHLFHMKFALLGADKYQRIDLRDGVALNV